MVPTTATRPYRKRRRAEQEEETRRRITEAVMELHRTVGPARTTVTAVADLAGVSRVTVYNHFPTDAELIAACSTHWAARHPFPDLERWRVIEDPEVRLATALADLYAWYRRTEDMMSNVLRDAPMVPALGDLMEERWWGYVARLLDVLQAGREERPEVRAALRLAVDFATWRTLTREGLGDRAAAGLAAGLPALAAGREAAAGGGAAPHRR